MALPKGLVLILITALALAGCAGGDPANTVLEPGTLAVVASDGPTGMDTSDRNLVYVQPGSTVRIGHDPGEYKQFPEDVELIARGLPPDEAAAYRKAGPQTFRYPDESARRRRVQVTVESGPAAGLAGAILRQDLRPVPR